MDERPKTTPYSLSTGREARERIETVLMQTQIGTLGLSDQNVPYVVPMNHLYIPGHLIFHGPFSTGRKMEMIARNPFGCYTVVRPLEELKADTPSCHVDYESVICNGRVCPVESLEARIELIQKWRAYYQTKGTRPAEEAAKTTGFFKFLIDEMTLRSGRFHPNGSRPLYSYTFREAPQCFENPH